MQGHIRGDAFRLTELRTSWGTTVPIEEGSEATVTFSVNGRYIRADPDYLQFEWVNNCDE